MVRLLSVTCESLQATHEHVTWEKVGTRVVMQGTADLRVSRAPKGSHFSASTVKDETEGFPGGSVATTQKARVQSLIREDSPCHGTTKPVFCNY